MQAETASRSEWLKARLALMEKERELTLLKDEVTAQRQALPLVAVEKDYRFQTESGEKSLAELFGTCEQLVVYHFMFGPDWDQGCPSCSFWADNYNGTQKHLRARNTQLVAVSNAPLKKLLDYRRRLGWSFDWVSAEGSTFTGDFGASFHGGDTSDSQLGYNYSGSYHAEESPGISTFIKLDDGRIAHNYSTFARGLEPANGAYHLLDMTVLGRAESKLPFTMAWVKRNDEYEQSA
ncbi:MAG: DUF899 domain-containing protein [Halioglobus sp.]